MSDIIIASRRRVLAGLAGFTALSLAGCASTSGPGRSVALVSGAGSTPSRAPATAAGIPGAAQLYAAMPAERFPIPAVQLHQLEAQYVRQHVAYETTERAGTVVIDTPNRFLYLVDGQGGAMRYGVGIGRDGFAWGGRATIGFRRAWPRWTPPSEMIERQPELEIYRHGMEPGLENPLGARALYIVQGGRDTLYRVHGTLDAVSIGKAVSSGCVRLLSQDIIDLHDRVRDGAPILVLQ